MNNKSKWSSIAEAGINIIAKLKRKTKDVIIPQDISYTEGEDIVFETEKTDDNVRRVIRKIENNEPEFVTEESAEAAEEEAQEALSHFHTITSKIENIKNSLLDVITKSESKRDELLKSGLKKEDLQKELDKTVTEIDEKLTIIKQMMDKTSEIIVSFDNTNQSNYTELSENLKIVSENAEKTGQRIETIEGALNEAKKKVGEIHQTTASIDKLYDSVFELKTANIENKAAIEALTNAGKKRFALMFAGICTFGAVSVASLVITILILALK